MAVASVFAYRQEKDLHLVSPAEPQKTSTQTETQTTFAPDANIRATFQDLTDAVRDLPTEEVLSLEIEGLCNATLAIDRAFCDIGKGLSDALGVQRKRVDVYDICYALEAQWNEHHLVSTPFNERRSELTRNIDISGPPVALQRVCWGGTKHR